MIGRIKILLCFSRLEGLENYSQQIGRTRDEEKSRMEGQKNEKEEISGPNDMMWLLLIA
jgi:hypothetical protein